MRPAAETASMTFLHRSDDENDDLIESSLTPTSYRSFEPNALGLSLALSATVRQIDKWRHLRRGGDRRRPRTATPSNPHLLRSGTDLIYLFFLFFFFDGATSSKKSKAPAFQIGSG